MRPGDAYPAAAPFFHTTGLSLAIATLAIGGTLIFDAPKTLDEQWDMVARRKVTVGRFPGFGLLEAARHPSARTHAGSLRIVFGRGGEYGAVEHAELAELLPHTEYFGGYGSTEAGNFVTRSYAADEIARTGTVGRPIFGFRAVILDDDDNILPPGEAGQLGLRGASVMSGYWGNAEAAATALRNGWMHTGDIHSMDDDGFLYMLDPRRTW